MKNLRSSLAFLLSLAASAHATGQPGVKDYLLATTAKMQQAAADFEKNAAAYSRCIDAAGGDYARALQTSREPVTALVHAMREDYKAMDSFGYENIEGIVAGVQSLADFDVYLDSGLPRSEAGSPGAQVAPVVLKTKTGRVLDHEGCLFTYLIEPALWGKKYSTPVNLDGDGKMDAKETLPLADVLLAAAADVRKKIDELAAASAAWQPAKEDLFAAMVTMTPTLSGYFDDWKESRYAPETSGKFSAVSRVSDMRGIMSGVAVIYAAVAPEVRAQDAALARNIARGFEDILAFIDRVEAREQHSRITIPVIDELGTQAKEKADKLVPQVEQAAALLKVNTHGV